MNKKLLKPVLILAGSALILTGCIVRERPAYSPGSGEVSADVQVNGPPPPDLVEPMDPLTPPPGPAFVWIGGYYGWVGGGWHWYPGHWDRRPHPGAVWMRPHYVYRGGRHVWVRGGWR